MVSVNAAADSHDHPQCHMRPQDELFIGNNYSPHAVVREGHGAMVRAWRSADVAACRAVLNPAWCRIFREI